MGEDGYENGRILKPPREKGLSELIGKPLFIQQVSRALSFL
jgi:hypothetical protein